MKKVILHEQNNKAVPGDGDAGPMPFLQAIGSRYPAGSFAPSSAMTAGGVPPGATAADNRYLIQRDVLTLGEAAAVGDLAKVEALRKAALHW